MATSRRLAAILAADVAGYSLLMGADEEGTLARVKTALAELVDPAVAVHHGRTFKTMGDGFLGGHRHRDQSSSAARRADPAYAVVGEATRCTLMEMTREAAIRRLRDRSHIARRPLQPIQGAKHS